MNFIHFQLAQVLSHNVQTQQSCVCTLKTAKAVFNDITPRMGVIELNLMMIFNG